MTNFEKITTRPEVLAENLIFWDCNSRGYALAINEEMIDEDGDRIASFLTYEDAIKFAIQWLKSEAEE